MAGAAEAAEQVSAPPREWWQGWAERRAAWWSARPVLARRMARVRAIGLWIALVWVAGLWVFWPDLRSGLLAYVGALWVVVAWFFLARTKTLTWSGYLRFYAACIGWSYLLGVVLAVLAAVAGGWGSGGHAAGVAIAGIAEETLKLLPVVVVAVLAPRRVARFAAVDWVLLGLAAGTAFLVVEESARRVGLWVVDSLGSVIARAFLDPGQVPQGWTQFGWFPVPTRWVNDSGAFGGHAIMTAIVAGLIGLSVVAWQRTRTTPGAKQVVVRVVVVAVPVLGLVSAVADHAANNASIYVANSLTPDGTPRWLHPELTTVPWWLRVPWSLLGNGHGRIGLFLGIVVACLIVDAARLTSRPGANLLVRPTPGWVTDVGTRTSNVLARVPDRVAVAVNHVLRGAAGLIWMSGRDLSEQVIAHARVGDEPRREALARGAATASAQRAVREVTYDTLSAPVRAGALRLSATVAAVLLLLGALVLAPATAVDIGYRLFEPGNPDWLAGTLDGLGSWWHGLNPFQQIAIGAGIAALIALSGGSLALAFGIAGVATWGLDKAHGIATFTRNPEQATLDYFLTATPGQYLADTLGAVLTFAPGNFAGAAAGRGLRPALTEFLHNPGGFLARRRTALRSDAGQIPVAGRSARESPPRSVASRVGARSADTTVDRAALQSGARYGPGWRRVDDGPTDPDYALPRPDHAAQVPTWAKPPAETSPAVAELGGDVSRAWGRDAATGQPLTEQDWVRRYITADGDLRWPPNGGAVPGTRIAFDDPYAFTEMFGTRLDRIGEPGGSYLGVPPGTTWAERSLPPDKLGANVFQYEINPAALPDRAELHVSEIAGAFGQPGGGVQLQFVMNEREFQVWELIEMGVLR